jgi:hypothetical protein
MIIIMLMAGSNVGLVVSTPKHVESGRVRQLMSKQPIVLYSVLGFNEKLTTQYLAQLGSLVA